MQRNTMMIWVMVLFAMGVLLSMWLLKKHVAAALLIAVRPGWRPPPSRCLPSCSRRSQPV
jgi:hypothetical protein